MKKNSEKKADEEDSDRELTEDEDSLDVSKDSIEDLVMKNFHEETPIRQRVNQSISPVLELRTVSQPQLETEMQEASTPQISETSEQSPSYAPSKYYSDNYKPNETDYPKILTPANSTLDQDISRVQQFQPRLIQSENRSEMQNRERDWEKKYEAKFAGSQRDRRRF